MLLMGYIPLCNPWAEDHLSLLRLNENISHIITYTRETEGYRSMKTILWATLTANGNYALFLGGRALHIRRIIVSGHDPHYPLAHREEMN